MQTENLSSGGVVRRSITWRASVLFFAALLPGSCGSEGEAENPGPAGGGLGKADLAGPVVLVGDTNRDGKITAADEPGRASWSWKSGALFLANMDDDNLDGVEDYKDGSVNSGGDDKDIALVEIRLAQQVAQKAKQAYVKVVAGPAGMVNLFERTYGVGNGWNKLPASGKLSMFPTSTRVGIEARHFAGVNGWDGRVTLQVDVRDGSNVTLGKDKVMLRVAPWIMLPNSAKTEELYISNGKYSTAYLMAQGLKAISGLKVVEYRTWSWQEMWMQDTMEIGYTEMPGAQGPRRMWVALRANRCGAGGSCDRFARTRLGKDFGFMTASSWGASGYGAWDDWLGNLEVSHPVPGWPLGRIYYGINLNKGWKKFLQAQEVQRPFEIDPTWLMIKHVDEVMNFVPGPDGKARMIIVSPRAAYDIIGGTYYGPYNKGIEAKIQKTIATAKRELGLTDAQIIKLPLYFAHGGVAEWSNPVNSVYLNGTQALGNTDNYYGVNQVAKTSYGKAIAKEFQDLGIAVKWVDDRAYQPNHGNVHCGTNTKRTPLVDGFWGGL
jgi:protein-arginine deiminase